MVARLLRMIRKLTLAAEVFFLFPMNINSNVYDKETYRKIAS